MFGDFNTILHSLGTWKHPQECGDWAEAGSVIGCRLAEQYLTRGSEWAKQSAEVMRMNESDETRFFFLADDQRHRGSVSVRLKFDYRAVVTWM